MEPVPVRRMLPILQNILKCPEPPAHMVKHAVQHNPYIRFVQFPAHIGKIFICAKPYIKLFIIPRIVPMSI